MANKGQLVVRFVGDTRDLSKSTVRVSKSLGGVSKLGKGLAIGVAAVAAGVGAVAVQTTKDLMRIERLGAQTEAVIKATGGAAGRTRAQVDKLAGRLEKMSGAEAEVITEGQNMLLTFKNVKGKQFDQATKSMLDMGVAMNKGSLQGLDLQKTSILMGKALNDPIKGLTALSRVGVSFSEQQKKQIKRMQEAGNVAGAQGIILKELQSEFGGAAKAAGSTTEGMIAKIKNSFGDIAERTLSFLLPMLQKLTKWVQTKVMPALARFGDWLRDDGAAYLKRFGEWIKNNVLPPLGAFAGFLMRAGKWLAKNKDFTSTLVVVLGTMAGVIGIVVGAMKVWAAVQLALNAVMSANPIGVVIVLVAALVAGLAFFLTKTKLGQKIVKNVWGAIKSSIKGVSDWWSSTAWPAIKKGIDILGRVFRFYGALVRFVWVTVVWGTLKRVWGWIKKNVIDKFVLGLKVWAAIFRLLSSKAAGYFAGLRDRLGRIGAWIRENVFGRMRSALGTMRDAFRTARDKIGDIWNGLKKLAAKPINFVLGTVYNKGIRAWVGKIFDFFGKSNPLPEAKMVQFAKGSEDHRAQIARAGAMRLWAEPETGGEAYIPLAGSKRSRSTKILADVAGRFGYGLQKYADGGFSFGLSDALKFAGDTGGWLKDKLTGFVSDKFGAGRQGGIWDMMRLIPGTIISNMGGWAKDKLGSLFGGLFGGGGKGAKPMGWKAMWDAVKGAFPTANLNSAYRPGAITAVGTPSYHGMGRAIDVSPSMAIFNWLAKTFPFSTELIYSPAGGRQLYKGRPTLFGEPTRGDHWDHVHWAMKNGGLFNKVPTFDNGGTLGPGMNLVNNATGRPEHLSPDDRPIVIHLHTHMDGKQVAEAIVEPIRGIVKTRGHGSVQATFGRGNG